MKAHKTVKTGYDNNKITKKQAKKARRRADRYFANVS